MALDQGPGRQEAVLARSEAEIHQDHLDGRYPHLAEELCRRSDIPNYGQINLAFQGARQTQPKDWVVIHDTDTDRFPSYRHWHPRCSRPNPGSTIHQVRSLATVVIDCMAR